MASHKESAAATAANVRAGANVRPTVRGTRDLQLTPTDEPGVFLNDRGQRRDALGTIWGLPENAPKPRGRPFEKGSIANPLGRPKGRPDRRTAYRESIEMHVPELIDRVVQMALLGDVQALRLCLERVLPPLRSGNEIAVVDVPADSSATGRAEAIVGAALAGAIPVQTAADLLGLLANQVRITEVDDLAVMSQ